VLFRSDETDGDWTGKAITDGTYVVSVWGYKSLTLSAYGESNSYRAVNDAATSEFLVGSATDLESWSLIDGEATCYACHNDLYLHGGGRRGFAACIACHGAAGSEDRSQYVASNAPATSRVSVSFRDMLHKIHMGDELTNADSYEVVGFGSSAWPNNYSLATYEEVGFPTMPSGVKKCTSCHGANNTSWYTPSDRNHPTDQTLPAREWRAVCGTCHDADYAQAHIDVQTSLAGQESCEACHGPDDEISIELVHKVR
jgi:OmcA/MtrC family decaheme c-type cytochrome